jgi:MscS family membrane protein
MTAVLAGLGVGGLAVAFAAQKTLENLFGGVAIIADQPVLVGDFCKFGDQMGTVEDIGLRSTRIRTLDRTLVTVPNGHFSSLSIENFAPRDKVRFQPFLHLPYDTSGAQIRSILEGVRELLKEHDKVEEGARARMIGVSDFSFKLELFAYIKTADYNEFLEIQEELLLRILETIESAGARLAVPAQETHVRGGEHLPPPKTPGGG